MDWLKRETLLEIAIKNEQVQWILNDDDVKCFYDVIIESMNGENSIVKEVKKIMEELSEDL